MLNAPSLLADMISLKHLIVAGGVMLLVIGGTVIAISVFVAGLIKRRKNGQQQTPFPPLDENSVD